MRFFEVYLFVTFCKNKCQTVAINVKQMSNNGQLSGVFFSLASGNESIISRFSAAIASACLIACVYIFVVVVGLAWPSRAAIVVIGTWEFISNVALVCLNPWIVTWGRPLRLIKSVNQFVSVSGWIGVPVSVVNSLSWSSHLSPGCIILWEREQRKHESEHNNPIPESTYAK